MSKVIIRLNKQSIKKAIDKLNKIQSQLESGAIIEDFLGGVCRWLIHRATYYVNVSDIGDNVKTDINAHWSYAVNGSKAIITNDADQAVFVEFGVGNVGKSIPHPNANVAVDGGYIYNKNNHRAWVFYAESEDDVDMHKGYIAKERKNGGLWIITKGSWRVMYAYNAIVDARNDLMNPNGQIAQIWKSVKSRYF